MSTVNRSETIDLVNRLQAGEMLTFSALAVAFGFDFVELLLLEMGLREPRSRPFTRADAEELIAALKRA